MQTHLYQQCKLPHAKMPRNRLCLLPSAPAMNGFNAFAGVVAGPVQEDLKREITSWLEALHKDRAWLAEQCQVTQKTVDRWMMSWTNIPETRKKRIHEIMTEHPAPRQ